MSDQSPEWIHEAIEQHQGSLVRYAQHFVGDLQRAQDVVQDTFLKLCNQDESKRKEIRPHLTKWLFRVCRNRAIDVSRKENRMTLKSSEQFDEQVSSKAKPPGRAIEAQEQHKSVAEQISQLPTNQQEVLRLKFNGGLSYKQIAEVTGLTTTNVGFLLHTAIKKLRHSVAPQG